MNKQEFEQAIAKIGYKVKGVYPNAFIYDNNGKNTGIIGTLYSRYAGKTITAKFTTPMANELQKTFKDMKDKLNNLILLCNNLIKYSYE